MANKYHAKKCRCSHGCKHDSRMEARRCETLHQLEQAGKIACLAVHPKYVLLEPLQLPWRREKAVTYTADFAYTLPTGDRVVEDVKSDATRRARELEFERYPTYKKAYITAIGKMIKAREAAGLKPFAPRTAQGMFDWWMETGILDGQLKLEMDQDE